MTAFRLQFLVCPQRDFIGTRDELERSLLKEYDFDAQRQLYTAKQAADRLEKPGDPVVPRDTNGKPLANAQPIREFWDLVKEKRRLHVGPASVAKLRGKPGDADLFVNTVKQLYEDTSHPLHNRIKVVLDEDWHPRSCGEFPIFGVHCVKGSEGAMLAGELQKYRWDNRTHVLRANSVNPAANPDEYRKLMEQVLGGEKPEYIKCGIMGVYTHIKVEYLAVVLSTMWPYFNTKQIGICGPLCASAQEADHEAGLRKLEILGYRVFRELPAYFAWLAEN